MQQNFNIALAHVLQYEGGYSDHPLDPGGATNYGITIYALKAWRQQTVHPVASVTKDDVKALSIDEAKRIYYARYWLGASCDQLPGWLAIAVFDCAVNQGTNRAKTLLQASLGVRVDGVIGPVTRAAIFDLNPYDRAKLLNEFLARRMHHYGRLSNFRAFGLGWSRRLMATAELSSRELFMRSENNAV